MKSFISAASNDEHHSAYPLQHLIQQRINPRVSVADDIEAVLRKIEYWHQGSISGFKIKYRDESGIWYSVRWNGQRVQERGRIDQ